MKTNVKSPTSLKDLESTFQNYLMHANSEMLQHVVSTDKVPAEIRLGIYGNAYHSRLHEALVASYPILEAYCGADGFQDLCYAYVDAHPSTYRSVRWFGDQMADFIQSYPGTADHPYLSELALLEWTMALVFDAADGPVLQLEDMSTLSPEDWITMRLTAHPSIRRLALNWNVVPIWQAITDENEPMDPLHRPEKVEWLLWRNDYMSHFSSIPTDEAWAIDALIQGQSFSEICEGLCQWNDEADAGMRAASLLKGWIEAGLISGFYS